MAEHANGTTLVWLSEQAQEDALHANRLLPVEERPFQRVTKNLLGKTSLVRPIPNRLPSPPPEDETGAATTIPYQVPDASQLNRFHEDILLDFAALESSITRIQLIQSSNERERERYAVEKAKILDTAQAVRDNTVQLHEQLAEAQRILELRKGYDELASKILDDKKLRSREESRIEIEKLEKEIEDLQQESADYEDTWVSRREQFDRMVAEGDAMIRLIKGIKDEPEIEGDADKDENMEDDDDIDGAKIESSRNGTPMPDGRSPRPTDFVESSENDGVNHLRPTNKFLDIHDNTRSNSRASTPLTQVIDAHEDVEMTQDNVPPSTSDSGSLNPSGQEAHTASLSTPSTHNNEPMDDIQDN